jgi:hypothetical protein
VKAYVFADRFVCPEFRRIVNKNFVNDMVYHIFVFDVENLLPCVQEAYASIPPDQPILQLLVDLNCDTWMQCCEEGPVSEFPHAFVVRAMRRLHEKLVRKTENCPEELAHCYYEHASNDEKAACLSAHMEYDKGKDFGFFGKRFTCDPCSEADDLGTEQWSESENEQSN